MQIFFLIIRFSDILLGAHYAKLEEEILHILHEGYRQSLISYKCKLLLSLPISEVSSKCITLYPSVFLKGKGKRGNGGERN